MISLLMIRWSENTLVSWTSTSFIWRFFWEKHVLENVKFNCLENWPKTRNSNDAHYEYPKMLDLCKLCRIALIQGRASGSFWSTSLTDHKKRRWFYKSHVKTQTDFVTSAMRVSVWNVFIIFRWPIHEIFRKFFW